MPNFLFNTFRRIVFLVGDTRRIKHFPWVTWDVSEHEIGLDEVIREALPVLKKGDVPLHLDKGFLSNAFIPGAMVHAGLYVGDGYLIEAISNGVVKRHAAYLLRSDYACIMRPRIGDEGSLARDAAVNIACEWAERIVDFPYDVLFNFCGEEDRALIREHGRDAIKHGVRFCCTEIPFFCYLDYLTGLRLFRRRNINLVTWMLSWVGLGPGEVIVDADMYVTAEFDMVWCSRSMTVEWCKRMKCEEAFIHKVSEYWKTHSICPSAR